MNFKESIIKKYKINSVLLDDYVRFVNFSVSPYIIEKRRDNLTQMDVFTRLMMERVIFLGAPINDEISNIIQAQLLFLQSLNPHKDICMYINSPGGSVYAGLGIYDTMQIISPEVSTICTGLAASMGAVILCAGKKGKRHGLKHSRIMLHQPMGGYHGQASDVKINTKEILKIKKLIYKILSKHSGNKFNKISKDADRDYWMDSREAKRYGIIDKIIKKHK